MILLALMWLEYSCSPLVEVIPSADPMLSISSGSCTQDVPSPQVVVSSQEVPSSQDLELSSTVTKTVDKFYFDVTRLRVNRKKRLVQIFMCFFSDFFINLHVCVLPFYFFFIASKQCFKTWSAMQPLVM